MPIPTSCPHCRYGINLPDHLRGQKVRCARCQKVFVAAAASRPSASQAAPARSRQGSGVSHMTLVMGMAIAFLLAIIVVGAGAFYFVLQNRQPSDTSVASRTDPTTAKEAPPVEKKLSTVEDPPAKTKEPPVKEPPPKEKEPTPTTTIINQVGDGSLTPEILQRVKRSTVYLRVTLTNGEISQGTGFVGVEPATIITNAHVLQMLKTSSPAPKQIEVIFNSGHPDERIMPGQLIGLDRVADLAILKLEADKLPPPLPVLLAKDLIETQQVFVCGFPLGQRLGKEITIGNSRVASLRREGGVLTRIQLSGEMNPGNSGGPIIDTKGNVIGVAVSGVVQTTINFAIPGENVHALLNGRIERARFGVPFVEGQQLKTPATVKMMDPLKRVQNVAVEVWTGDNGDARPASLEAPKAQAGDSPRQQSALTYRNGLAEGEVNLPALPEGKVYWIQLAYTPATGASRWSQANVYRPQQAVERKPVTLPAAHKVGSQPLEVASDLTLRVDRGENEDVINLALRANLQEQVQTVDNQGTSTIRLQYQKIDTRAARNGQASPLTTFQQIAPKVPLVAANMQVDRKGTILVNQADLSKVPPNPPGERNLLNSIADQIQHLVQALTVPLVGSNVQPGQTWTAQRLLPIDTLGRYDSCVIDCTYRYLGVRSRGGKQEAVIEVLGDIKPRQGSGAEASGVIRGTAVVDLATGLIASVEATVNIDMSVPNAKGAFQASGLMDLKLQRGATAN